MSNDTLRVVVTDIEMPFWSMVLFMIKWAVATIPAVIGLYALGFFLMSFLPILNGLIR